MGHSVAQPEASTVPALAAIAEMLVKTYLFVD